MFLSKKHLSRRTFLHGSGLALSLPLLDAMIPAGTALASTAARARPLMGFFYLPHGAIMDSWTPEQDGREFTLSPILEPLAPFRQALTIVSGLDNKPARSSATHAIVPGTWLSCVAPRQSSAPFGGVTIDQIAAQYIGQGTQFPTLEVATEESGGSAACTGAYGCSFGKTISFRTPTTPLPMEYSPRKLFYRLFGQGDSAEERVAIAGQYGSVLDMVLADAADMQRRLGPADRRVLGDYLQSVREIERRVQQSGTQDLSEVELPDIPRGIVNFDERVNLMFDLIAVAYQANLTRIASFMMAAEVSNQAYSHIGVSEAFHPLSHHNNAPAAMEKLVRVQRWHSEAFARFLEKMAQMPDGDGTMLEHAVFLYGSNMSNSNLHDHFPLPSAVLGHGCGRIRGGQHLRYPDRTPLANLMATLLERVGAPVDSVGDSTGLLNEI